MKTSRISRAASVGQTYVAPGGGHIHRVFDTAAADDSLLEVEYSRNEDGSISLKYPPASQVWVEHEDTTMRRARNDGAGEGGHAETAPVGHGAREIILRPGESLALADGTRVCCYA